MTDLSPERQRVAKILKKHIGRALAEIGTNYYIELEGKFDEPSIKLIISVLNY